MGYLDVYRSYWGRDEDVSNRFGTYSRALAGRDDLKLNTTKDENLTAHIKNNNEITVTHPKVVQKQFGCDSETAFTISKALTAHEAAHAKYTPTTEYQDILKDHWTKAEDEEDMNDFVGAMNAIEDLRINALQGARRPGFDEDYTFYEKTLAKKMSETSDTSQGIEYGIVKWLFEQRGAELTSKINSKAQKLYEWLKDNVDGKAIKTLPDTETCATELYRKIRELKGKKDSTSAQPKPQEGAGEEEQDEPKGEQKGNQKAQEGDKSEDGEEGQEGSQAGVSTEDDDDDGDGYTGSESTDGDGDEEDDEDDGDANGSVSGGVGATNCDGPDKPAYDIKDAMKQSLMDKVFNKEDLKRYIQEVQNDRAEDDYDAMYNDYRHILDVRSGKTTFRKLQTKEEFIRTRRMTAIPGHGGVPVYRYGYNSYRDPAEGAEHEELKMSQESQAKALSDTLKRIMDEASEAIKSKSGTLTARRAYRHEFSKHVFHKNTQDTGGYAVVLLLDESGSMSSKWSHVHKIAYTIARAFVLAGIPLEVLAFSDSGRTFIPTLKEFDSADCSKITMYSPTRSNRDGLAVHVASMDLMERQEENKILVVLSDGNPASSGCTGLPGVGSKHAHTTIQDYEGRWNEKADALLGKGAIDTAQIVRKVRAAGVHVGGIYYGTRPFEMQTIKGMYGNDFANVTDLARLPHIMAQFFERFASK